MNIQSIAPFDRNYFSEPLSSFAAISPPTSSKGRGNSLWANPFERGILRVRWLGHCRSLLFGKCGSSCRGSGRGM